ncbi:hypothetical protein ACFE04_018449 [Oxalis oulophora]
MYKAFWYKLRCTHRVAAWRGAIKAKEAVYPDSGQTTKNFPSVAQLKLECWHPYSRSSKKKSMPSFLDMASPYEHQATHIHEAQKITQERVKGKVGFVVDDIRGDKEEEVDLDQERDRVEKMRHSRARMRPRKQLEKKETLLL